MLSSNQSSAPLLSYPRAHRHGKDITNPRDWYTLLSERVRHLNGAIEYSHPNDNRFLPRLAYQLDLCYGATSGSPSAGQSTYRRSSMSKSSSAYQHESPLKRNSTSLQDLTPTKENTMSTLASFYKKEYPSFKRKPNRVTFVEVDIPEHQRSVSLPRLSMKPIPGIMPEINLLHENAAHSHNENLEEWFSQMPDETTTKAKRTLMEQKIQEKIKRKGTQPTVPLPKVTKQLQEKLDMFPASYKELLSNTVEDSVTINRDIYRLQLKSLLKLNDGNLSGIDRLDRRQRDYIVVSPIHRDVSQGDTGEHEETPSESECESDLGFDPEKCPLFIVSTKRSIPLDIEACSNHTLKQGSMPKQKKLKRLKNAYTQKVKERQQFYLASESYMSNESESTIQECVDEQHRVLTRQPKHILEYVKRQEIIEHNKRLRQENAQTPKETTSLKLTPLRGNVRGEFAQKTKTALLAKYKRLEVFSESKANSGDFAKGSKVVEVNLKREIPQLYSPVYKLDSRYAHMDFSYRYDYLDTFHNDDRDIIPIRIENGVVIVGSATSSSKRSNQFK